MDKEGAEKQPQKRKHYIVKTVGGGDNGGKRVKRVKKSVRAGTLFTGHAVIDIYMVYDYHSLNSSDEMHVVVELSLFCMYNVHCVTREL